MDKKERIHRARVFAGRKGGSSPLKKGRRVTKLLEIDLQDHMVLKYISEKKKTRMKHIIHLLAESLVKKYPESKPDIWDKKVKRLNGHVFIRD